MTVQNELVLGKKAAEAREIVAEELKKNGLVEKEEEITQNVSTAERTGGIIEPLPKLQWFIGVNSQFAIGNSQLKGIKSGSKVTLKQLMKHAVESGEIKITPERSRRSIFTGSTTCATGASHGKSGSDIVFRCGIACIAANRR